MIHLPGASTFRPGSVFSPDALGPNFVELLKTVSPVLPACSVALLNLSLPWFPIAVLLWGHALLALSDVICCSQPQLQPVMWPTGHGVLPATLDPSLSLLLTGTHWLALLWRSLRYPTGSAPAPRAASQARPWHIPCQNCSAWCHLRGRTDHTHGLQTTCTTAFQHGLGVSPCVLKRTALSMKMKH